MQDQTPENGFWIRKISEGNLSEPSSVWISQFKKFEEIFKTLNPKNTISKQRNVINLTSVLNFEFPDIPTEVIHYYSRVRTFVRIASLNREIEVKKFKFQEAVYRAKKLDAKRRISTYSPKGIREGGEEIKELGGEMKEMDQEVEEMLEQMEAESGEIMEEGTEKEMEEEMEGENEYPVVTEMLELLDS